MQNAFGVLFVINPMEIDKYSVCCTDGSTIMDQICKFIVATGWWV